MKLVVLDPGYEHVHAHHHAVNIGIHQAWARKGIPVIILAGKRLDQPARSSALSFGMESVPYFSTPGYPEHADRLPRREHEILSELYCSEIVALFSSGFLRGDEYLLVHTGYSFHVAGLALALWRSQRFIKGARLLVSMMFHPGAAPDEKADTGIRHIDRREFLRHKLALKLLHAAAAKSALDVCLATSCRSFQRIYETLWPGGDVVVHPAVGFRPLKVAPPNESGRTRVLLYMGGAKADKGIVFAAQLGAAAALAYPDVEFVFHFNDAFPGAHAFRPAVDELVRAGARHNSVFLISGNLEQEAYDELLQSSSIVCLLYDPAYYNFKTSGVFWDALRKDSIRWLVTADTWPASELTQLELSHAQVDHGDIVQGVNQLGYLLAQTDHETATSDIDYRNLLNSSFGDWLYDIFFRPGFEKKSSRVSRENSDFRPGRGRILVVRTQYAHFSPFSGPGGFIPHLRGLGYEVEEMLVPLGSDRIEHAPHGLRDEFRRLSDSWLRSYQGNGVLAETEIQRRLENYDVVHFLDAEHCGLLTALLKLQSPSLMKAQLVATYHQPGSIMRDIVVKPHYLNGFDRIHLLSPCQRDYFTPYVDASKLIVVPHGLAPELLEHSLPSYLIGVQSNTYIPELEATLNGRKIILTVGNWLRDFDQLLATAAVLLKRLDLLFVVVSKGLILKADHLPNVLVLNKGLSDSQLHALYLKACLLFLPLKDGAANNAILESMAHGLPIVTTDLPSTRFYTDGQAVFCRNHPQAYAEALEQTSAALEDEIRRSQLSMNLRKRGSTLVWKRIARQMEERLY